MIEKHPQEGYSEDVRPQLCYLSDLCPPPGDEPPRRLAVEHRGKEIYEL